MEPHIPDRAPILPNRTIPDRAPILPNRTIPDLPILADPTVNTAASDIPDPTMTDPAPGVLEREQCSTCAELRASEKRYRQIVESLREGIWQLDAQDNTIFVNQRLADLLGYSVEELYALPFSAFFPADSWQQVQESRKRRRLGEPGHGEVRYRRKDGTEFWGWRTSTPHIDSDGNYLGVHALISDITDRKRAERSLMVTNAARAAVLHAGNEIDLLQRVCDAIIAVGGYRLAWIGYLQPEPDKSIRPVVRAGPASSYVDEIVVTWDDTPTGWGPIGRTIRTGVPQIVRDTQTDVAYDVWRAPTKRWGIGSTLTFRLVVADTVIGALGIYAAEPRSFDDAEQELWGRLAEDLSYGIAARRAEAERALAQAALRAADARYQHMIETMHEGVWQLDAQHCTIYVNPHLAAMFGYTPAEMMGKPPWDFVFEADRVATQERLIRRRSGISDTRDVLYRRKDGSALWVRLHAEPFMDAEGCYLGGLGFLADITARKQMEDTQARLAAIVESSMDAIIGMDLNLCITSWNTGAERLFGYRADEVVGSPINLLAIPDDHDESVAIETALRRGESIIIDETQRRHRDGHHIPVSVSISLIRDAAGGTSGAAVIFRDNTERQNAAATLRHQALHDALTGLPNRTLLYDRLEHALLHAQRRHENLALLLLDLDRFKEVNDTFGHHHGDQMLCQIAQRLTGLLRATDTVARLGGDEFAVVLSTTRTPDEAMAIAAKISSALEASLIVEGVPLHVSASIGIALFPDHGTDGSTLLRHADVAMYTAKNGRTRHALYVPENDRYTLDRLSLIADLRAAISHGQLMLHYQPQVDLSSGTVVGMEALVRWWHPQRGMIFPDHFIDLAEQTGLIGPLTTWVIQDALRQWGVWQASGLHVPVAVNLSMLNLHDPHIPELIAQALTRVGAPGTALRLEVTETILMSDPTHVQQALEDLTKLGIRISIDDYGTGYSSLAYLKRLPVDELKIDRSFVQQLTNGSADAAIVAATIGLGHNLGLSVVAEGVETQETWAILEQLGCDRAQGYYISRPLPAAEVTSWMENWRPLLSA